MKYEVGGFSDKGKYREINQDRVVFLYQKDAAKELPALAAVCDGVGGSDHGEIAAEIVSQRLIEWYQGVVKWLCEYDVSSDQIIALLRDAIDAGNSDVREYCEKSGIKTATTMSVLLLFADNYHILHVGDSRIYSLGKNSALLTEDEKKFCENDKGGRFYLSNYVGRDEEIETKYYCGEIRKKDVFVLASDGFYNVFTKEDARKLCGDISKGKDLSEVSRKWVFAAEERDTRDNVSLVSVLVR